MCKPNEITTLLEKESVKYLSIKQISRKLNTTESDVLDKIKLCDSVFESFMLPTDGSTIFASKKRVNRVQDIWNAFRHISYLKATA